LGSADPRLERPLKSLWARLSTAASAFRLLWLFEKTDSALASSTFIQRCNSDHFSSAFSAGATDARQVAKHESDFPS
jgi:hypothetical protein